MADTYRARTTNEVVKPDPETGGGSILTRPAPVDAPLDALMVPIVVVGAVVVAAVAIIIVGSLLFSDLFFG